MTTAPIAPAIAGLGNNAVKSAVVSPGLSSFELARFGSIARMGGNVAMVAYGSHEVYEGVKHTDGVRVALGGSTALAGIGAFANDIRVHANKNALTLAGKITELTPKKEIAALASQATTKWGKLFKISNSLAIPIALASMSYSIANEEGSVIKENRNKYRIARAGTGIAATIGGALTSSWIIRKVAGLTGLLPKIGIVAVPIAVGGATFLVGSHYINHAKEGDRNDYVDRSVTFENMKSITQEIVENSKKPDLARRGARFTEDGALDMSSDDTPHRPQRDG